LFACLFCVLLLYCLWCLALLWTIFQFLVTVLSLLLWFRDSDYPFLPTFLRYCTILNIHKWKWIFMTAWLLCLADVLSSFMTYHRSCNKSNTTDATGTVYLFGTHEFNLGFSVVSISSFLCSAYFAFWWTLYCLLYKLRLLITLLKSLSLFYSIVFEFSSSLCIFNFPLLLTGWWRM
jgi:hypothetical protein